MKISNPFQPAIPLPGSGRATPANLRHDAEKGAAVGAATPSASATISSSAQLLAKAAADLGADLQIRAGAVQAARETLRTWQGLTTAQVGQIADGLLAELQ